MATLAIGLGLAATGFGMFSRAEAASARIQELQEEASEAKIAASTQASERAGQMKRLFSSQTASVAARGVSINSPSFAAINRGDFNALAEDNKLANLQLKVRLASLKTQESNASAGAVLGDASNLFEAASTAVSISNFGGSEGASSLETDATVQGSFS